MSKKAQPFGKRRKVFIELHKVSVSVPSPSRPLNGKWTWDVKKGLKRIK